MSLGPHEGRDVARDGVESRFVSPSSIFITSPTMNRTAFNFGSLSILLAFSCSSPSDDKVDSSMVSTGGNASTGGSTQSSFTGGMSNGGVGSGGASSGGQVGAGGSIGSGAAAGTGGGAVGAGGAGGFGSGGEAGSGGAASSGGAEGTGGASVGIRPGPVQICDPPATLKEAGECNGLLVGTALTPSHFSENAFTSAAREFNYATPENEMKWGNLQPQPGQFSFGQADQVVDFALQNGMKVKGHTLVWHMQLPAWVENLNSEDAVRSAMLTHIEEVMTHYKGKVVAWDVVNESSDIDDKPTGSGNPRFRDTVFYRYLGETYIDEAFIKAREVDPDVKLFYNDFGGDGLNEKSDQIYQIVKGLVDRGVPIDGVGMQGHMGRPNPVPPLADIKANFQRIADLGLEIQVSELDINGCDPNVSPAGQVEAYHNMVTACVEQPNCTAVSVWGITDKYSWVNSFDEAGCNGQSGRALLWDDNYQKKDTYDAMLNALIGQ